MIEVLTRKVRYLDLNSCSNTPQNFNFQKSCICFFGRQKTNTHLPFTGLLPKWSQLQGECQEWSQELSRSLMLETGPQTSTAFVGTLAGSWIGSEAAKTRNQNPCPYGVLISRAVYEPQYPQMGKSNYFFINLVFLTYKVKVMVVYFQIIGLR